MTIEEQPGRKPTHAELAARITEPPADNENEAIAMAEKTFRWTALLIFGFVAGAAYIMFLL